jgi:hypothetical protein
MTATMIGPALVIWPNAKRPKRTGSVNTAVQKMIPSAAFARSPRVGCRVAG